MTRMAIVGLAMMLATAVPSAVVADALVPPPDAAAVLTKTTGLKFPVKLPCFLVDKLCDQIAKHPITGTAGCLLAGAGAAGTCETIGLGPEDPWADVCAGVAGGALSMQCISEVSKGGSFNAPACRQAAHCPTNSISEVPKPGAAVVPADGSEFLVSDVPAVALASAGQKTTGLKLKLPCSVVDKLCDFIAKNPITGKAGCVAAGAGAATTCETIGLGPEDPLADVCAGVAGSALAMSCFYTISKGGAFNAPVCKQTAHCPTNSSSDVEKEMSILV